MLDRVERSLPGLPQKMFRLQRKLTEAGIEASRSALGVFGMSSSKVKSSTRKGAKTVAGQAKAEASQTVEVTADESASVLDRAERAVDGDDTARLEDWTKAELYERAQKLDIAGRSTMTKTELVDALRQA